ncbi:YHYH protein [Fulvivirga sp. M361]|uniref:YHYH protein n=1 Tax=Fulvivirga sp. M361 TaxID=2594266 RepID=UPI00117A4581|nr:YHYH protein [Fulvivirga sp. M361]TRX49024.1 YHYH protein [Fulvivirga sp. M361]
MKSILLTIGTLNTLFLVVAFYSAAGPDHWKDTGQGYFGCYELIDKTYGTKTIVTVTGNIRKIVTNALPNHETGNFPNPGNPNTISEQRRTYELPLSPVYKGQARWVREPGVALNGIKFEPQTAVIVQCGSGEHYWVEALQDLIDLGLDFNHAHVQPTGAYHYHGTPISLIEMLDKEQDPIHIGFAVDGFPIYYSAKGTYKSSYRLFDENREGTDCDYSTPHLNREIMIEDTLPDGTFGSDWEYVPGLGNLDECNGIMLNDSYAYFVTDEFPYVGRCLKGEFEEEKRHKPSPGNHPPKGRDRQNRPKGEGHGHPHD